MKKFISLVALIALLAHSTISRAFDEGSLVIPLTVTAGALVLSACYVYKQRNQITTLEAKLKDLKPTTLSSSELEETASLLSARETEIAKLTSQLSAQEHYGATLTTKISQQEEAAAALESKLVTKNKTILQLMKALNDEKKETVALKSFASNLSSAIPFMCVKEEVCEPSLLEKITQLNFEKSPHPHKIAGLVTYISNSALFTSQEKNMISDEEDSLEDRDKLLNSVDKILQLTKEKVGIFDNTLNNNNSQ